MVGSERARASVFGRGAVAFLGALLVDGLVHAEAPPRPPAPAPPAVVGVDPVLADLLVFRPSWISRLASSHDPFGGNNDNSGDLEAKEDGWLVLLHQLGEGRIQRMWMTADSSTVVPEDYLDLWIEIDGHTVYRGRPQDYFEGRGPFRAPLVLGQDASSGGFISYAPLPFRREAKVRMKKRPHYYQISYRTGPGASAGPSAEEITRYFSDHWCDAVHPTPHGELLAEGPLVVTRLGFSMTPAALVSARVRIEDDHSPTRAWVPRLEIPLAMLVGVAPSATPVDTTAAGLGVSDVNSALACARPATDRYATRLPIPLGKGQRLRLVTSGPIEADVGTAPAVPGVRLFSELRKNKGQGQKTTFSVLDAEGPVHVISQVAAMDGGWHGERGFLEGDEMIRFDGMRAPLHLGTGTEDYFDAAFYFQSVFSNPMSGMTRFKVLEHGGVGWNDATFEYSVYRHHVLDPLIGRTGLRFGWEAGADGAYLSILWTTLLLGYSFDGPRVVGRTRFVVGPAKEGEVSLGPAQQTVLSALDAEAGQAPQSFLVREKRTPTVLSVACPEGGPPTGALLVRTFDAQKRGQAAWIKVGGADSGVVFHQFAANPHRRLAEDLAWVDLFDGDCKNGKVRLEIWPVAAAPPFSESAYEVRLFRPSM